MYHLILNGGTLHTLLCMFDNTRAPSRRFAISGKHCLEVLAEQLGTRGLDR